MLSRRCPEHFTRPGTTMNSTPYLSPITRRRPISSSLIKMLISKVSSRFIRQSCCSGAWGLISPGSLSPISSSCSESSDRPISSISFWRCMACMKRLLSLELSKLRVRVVWRMRGPRLLTIDSKTAGSILQSLSVYFIVQLDQKGSQYDLQAAVHKNGRPLMVQIISRDHQQPTTAKRVIWLVQEQKSCYRTQSIYDLLYLH